MNIRDELKADEKMRTLYTALLRRRVRTAGIRHVPFMAKAVKRQTYHLLPGEVIYSHTVFSAITGLNHRTCGRKLLKLRTLGLVRIDRQPRGRSRRTIVSVFSAATRRAWCPSTPMSDVTLAKP